MTFVVGLDVGHPCVPAAEHWLRTVLPSLGEARAIIACTHVVSRPFPHVAVSLAVDRAVPRRQLPAKAAAVIAHGALPPVVANRDIGSKLVPAAARAAVDHATRVAGRAVVFPGVERLTGTLTVAEVLANSAIARVTLIDGAPPGSTEPKAGAKLDTRGHVRPQWDRGRLTLLVRPSRSGYLVPFEGPQPPFRPPDRPGQRDFG